MPDFYNNQSEQSTQDGANSIVSGISSGSSSYQTAKQIKNNPKIAKKLDKTNKIAKEGAKKLADKAKKGLFEAATAGLSTTSLIVIGIIAISLFSLIIIFSTFTPGTLFTNSQPKVGDISYSLSDGFYRTQDDARSYIADVLNSKYGCKASEKDVVKQKKGLYLVSTETCELNIKFEPELDTFAEMIDSYSNAINGAISIFGADKQGTESANKKIKITDHFTTMDQDGNADLSSYGRSTINNMDSEYADSQSTKQFKTLSDYSYSMFSYEENTDEWEFNTYKGVKPKKIKVCYLDTVVYDSLTKEKRTTSKKVSCSSSYSGVPGYREEEETIYIDAEFGDVTVFMSCDPTQYKKEFRDECVENAIGMEIVKEFEDDDGNPIKKKVTLDREGAKTFVQQAIDDYYFAYISLYDGGGYYPGYTGSVSPSGYNYDTFVDSSNTSAANKFWKHAESLDSILHTLKYATDSMGAGPKMTHQCTEFAATFFYDLYGFSALRGNGNMQATFLIKDCGSNSACPVKFGKGISPAPGAVVSLYPNHVIVVNEVNSDGSIVISEGNISDGNVRIHYKLDGGLAQYEREMGMRIKTIAIPLKEGGND